MSYKIIDVEFLAVFVPVIIYAACLADYDVSDDTVYLSERQSLVICYLAAVSFEYKTCSEALFLKRVLILANLGNQLEKVIVLSVEDVLKCQIRIVGSELNLMSLEPVKKSDELVTCFRIFGIFENYAVDSCAEVQ